MLAQGTTQRWQLPGHDATSLDKQRPQVVTLRDLAKDGAISGRDLFRHGAEPGAEVSFLAEDVAGADRGKIALEMIGPMPGTVISRSEPASALASASISGALSMLSSRRAPVPR